MTELAVVSKSTELEAIKQGLEAFNKRKEALSTLASTAKDLAIKGVEDKAGYKDVDVKRKELKAERIKVEKEAKSMRDMIRPVTALILESEKELVGLIEPEEKRLQGLQANIDAEKERIKQEELAKEEARIQTRIDALAEYGYQIDYGDIKSMSDETFDKYLEGAKAQYEKDQADKAEEERRRLEQEEAERIAREAEQKRIDAERAELEALRAKQAEAQRIIDEQKAAIEAKQREIEEEKARIEAEKKREEYERIRAEEIRYAAEKAAEEARVKAIQDAKEAEEKRMEDEQKAKELAERKAARQPDKVKIQQYISDIKAVPVPELKTEDGKSVMAGIQELISRFDNYATEKADQL